MLRCYKQYPRRAIISSYPRGYLYTYVIYRVILHYCGYGVCGRRRRRRLAHSIHGRRCEICSPLLLYAYPTATRVLHTRNGVAETYCCYYIRTRFRPVVAAAVRGRFISSPAPIPVTRFIFYNGIQARVHRSRYGSLCPRIRGVHLTFQVHDDDDIALR